MSRSRVIEVENCKECPFLYRISANKQMYCRNEPTHKHINNKSINKIQEWCTLEYYPYYYGNDGMKDEYGNY